MQPWPRRCCRREFDLYVWYRRYIPGEDLKIALETLKKGLKGVPWAVQKIMACARAICKQVLIVSWSLQVAFMPAGCDGTFVISHCL